MTNIVVHVVSSVFWDRFATDLDYFYYYWKLLKKTFTLDTFISKFLSTDLFKSIGADVKLEKGSILQLKDDVPEVSVDLPDVMVKIDGRHIPLKNGEFLAEKLSMGKHSIQVFTSNSLIYEKEYTTNSGMNHLPLEFELDFNNLVKNAGTKMNSTKEADKEENLVSPFYDPDEYYRGIKVGSYFGEGKGQMKMLTPEGHVSCNKSDYDHGANFPLNGADYTKSVAGGVLYLNNPSQYSRYIQGIFCVQEAMSSGEDSNESNSYCNHTPKSGGYYQGYKNMGYNCSSFTFLMETNA